MLSCLVLGGGLGSRLGDRTRDLPKPLVRVAGAPFIHHQLRWLVAQGVTDVAYSIGYLGHRIREELARRPPSGCSVRFVDEGPELLGTGGAVRLAVDEGAVGDPFLVLYGDSYLDIDVAAVVEAFEASSCGGLMTVFADPGAAHDNARFRAGRVERYDKTEPDPAGAGMEHVDYGLSILRVDTVLRLVPAGGPSDLADALARLSLEGGLAGYEATNRFFEIGSPEGLDALDAHLTGAAR